MAISGTIRSRNWRKNQRNSGKKPVSIWLSQETKNALDNKREKTRETLSGIIERLLRERLKIVTRNIKRRKIIRRKIKPIYEH